MTQKMLTKIAGLFSYPNAKEGMKAMKQGDPYFWEAEPTNPYDKNAIALFVEIEGQKIKCGYIPKVMAQGLTANRISAIVKGGSFDLIEITVKTEEDTNDKAN